MKHVAESNAVETAVDSIKEGAKLITPKRLLIGTALVVAAGAAVLWAKSRNKNDETEEYDATVEVVESKKSANK